MRFFVGIHQPCDAHKVDAAFISVSRLENRISGFLVGDWIMDSKGFSEVAGHGRYRMSVQEHAAQIRRWSKNGNLMAAIAQDWMCEDPVLKRVLIEEGKLDPPPGFDFGDAQAWKKLGDLPWAYEGQREDQILEHQRRTIERYDALMTCDVGGVYIMPVLQGYAPEDYVRHIRMYGDRLKPGMWVGVGSVCKRNSNPETVADVLAAIKAERPDLLLHGFGVKTTALGDVEVRDMLHTADSMAWSYNARINGRNGNDVREALAFAAKIAAMPRRPKQLSMFGRATA